MAWGKAELASPLPDYTSQSTALAAGESGTYNTNTILTTYTATDYPAFNFARNALTITVDNKTFESCLPNLKELDILYQDRTTLDTYDPTLGNYSTRSLSEFKLGSYGPWSSTQYDRSSSWFITPAQGGIIGYIGRSKNSGHGVCTIIEIPVDSNGTVL